MPILKKITTFTLALIVPISLISGYFCLAMPLMAQDIDRPAMDNMAACGKTAQTEHYMAPNDASTDAIALCCVAKRENSDAGILSLNEWSPSGVDQPIASVDVAGATSGNHLIFEDYPISPPPAEMLASVIKIE